VSDGDRSGHEPGEGVTVREYTHADWRGVCRVHDAARALELERGGVEAAFRPMRIAAEDEAFFDGPTLVACSGGSVIGFVSWRGDYLSWLYVDPAWHRRGAGRRLVREALSRIGPGAWTITLDGNHPAQTLFEGAGMRVVHRWSDDCEGQPCQALRLALPTSPMADPEAGTTPEGTMTIDWERARWINRPREQRVSEAGVEIVTEPGTDLWQRTYYGFRNDNAPALLLERPDDFTFTARADFAYRGRFDQCGLLVYLDGENWCKACVEYESGAFSRLGSVVTNDGHSDWATVDLATPMAMRFRLSRRGPDFLLEAALPGHAFEQMRVFHLHRLGETTAEMGAARSLATDQPVRFGPFACSPGDSSFTARFSEFELEPCSWMPHESF
jgi:uncharacterized protein